MTQEESSSRPLWPWRWQPWLIVLGLTVMATLLHLWRLDVKSIWWDESLSLVRAQQDIATILSNHLDLAGSESVDLHPPLYFLLLKAFVTAWGESDTVLRMPSVLCASMIVPLLYVLGSEIGSVLTGSSQRIGLISALLGTLSPFYLWYAQEARMYTMVTLVGLAAAICLWRLIQRGQWRWGIGFVALSAVSIATHYLHVLVFGSQCLALMLHYAGHQERHALQALCHDRRLRWALIIGLITIALLIALIAVVAWPHVVGAPDGRRQVSLPLMLRDAANSYSLGLTVSVAQVWPLTALMSLAFLAGVVRYLSSRRNRSSIVAGILLLGYALSLTLGMWAFAHLKTIYMGSRYVIMGSPAFYIGIAACIDWLIGQVAWPRVGQIVGCTLLAVFAAGMLYSDGRYFFHERYRTKEDHRSTAEHISARQQPGDLIIVNAPENLPAFLHYYQPLGGRYDETTVIGLPLPAMHPSFDHNQLVADLEDALQGHDRVWIAHCRTQHSDPEDLVLSWLRENTWRLVRQDFPSWGSSPLVELYRVEPHRQPLATPQETPILTLEGSLALDDVTIYARHDGACELATQQVEPASGVLGNTWSTPVDAGAYLSGDLTWTTLTDVDDLKAALTLRDDRGMIWTQKDSRLLGYTFSEAYDAHTRIIQDVWLRIPAGLPEATYTWELLIYQASSGQMLERDNHLGFGHPYIIQLATMRVQRSTPATWEDVADEGLERLPSKPTFGPTQLVAYSLGPEHIRAGEPVNLALVWEARAETDVDAVMLINWEDGQGNVWHSTSYPLAGLDDPRSTWHTGELVRGLVMLPTPTNAPSGEHTLHLLVHNPVEDSFYWRLWLGTFPTSRDLSLGTVVIE